MWVELLGATSLGCGVARLGCGVAQRVRRGSDRQQLGGLAWPSPPTHTVVVGFVQPYSPTSAISSPAHTAGPATAGAAFLHPTLPDLPAPDQPVPSSLLFSPRPQTSQQARPGTGKGDLQPRAGGLSSSGLCIKAATASQP